MEDPAQAVTPNAQPPHGHQATTPPEELLAAPETPEDGFGDVAMPGSAAEDRRAAAATPVGGGTGAADEEVAAIRAEGLTGRQLRMARRIAQKHGLDPSSDFDAVRQLRAKGINPFSQSNMLELVVGSAAAGAGATAATATQAQQDSTSGTMLPARTNPAKVPGPAAPPQPSAPQPLTADDRAAEIMKVQRDIARRRRKRLILLATRLAFFVLLPTLLVAFYYYRVATPLYATNSEFVIQKADSGTGAPAGLGSLFGGTSFATVQESITVQSYLESREAMLRLDAELGFRAHFSQPEIDPILRLSPDASNEETYAVYRRQLTIGYDPTEGLIKLEVRAQDPEVSQAFSEALIRYAEERVGELSQRLRDDQMVGARESFDDAQASVSEAQTRVLELQQARGVLSAEAEVTTVFQQITTFELQVQEERLRLAEIQASPRPNPTRVSVAEGNIERLEAVIADLRASLTEAEEGNASLARVQSELLIAQADLETRQMMLAAAMQQVETARIEANRQSLYLSVGVFPIAPDEAAYPKAFENTLLAFLIFSGIYLMISMTASILREQVSS